MMFPTLFYDAGALEAIFILIKNKRITLNLFKKVMLTL